MDERTRTHLAAVFHTFRDNLPGDDHPGALWVAGMLAGLNTAARIADGATAETAMEHIAHDMNAAVGQAYLNGDLPGRSEGS
ncbi:hypothetical protein [Streptomyces candidus]|uniref:Uncharacterized protein n=1 Tax=Streptomyces candidus TaxID=67283 RepID=A0A7X0HME0_9ACTN|nr:hypothetical protein [Streptomyces candidus]MBB6440118.1 hypothetical protein [Streptomyces candidus]GHH58271.1 hypothetical protein GCM10018773_66390 [Streptomyces candidus]